ncbi:MAG TPA: AAA family ATPase [Bacillota bacterium]|nr:AAA family ATPase [Bacillota bacterium]
MLIEKIDIKNFRSIHNAEMQCDSLTAILGRNGSGKSSFLQALEYFYDINAPITIEDFFNRDTENQIEIRVTYGNLRQEECDEFRSYIKDNRLIVTKRITYESGKILQKYYAAAMQIPEFAEIRGISQKSEKKDRWNELVESGKFIGLNKAKKADDIDKIMNDYEEAHPEFLEIIEKQEQFFGPKSVGGGKLDKYTKFVRIPAVRDASIEITDKKSGVLFQLLEIIVMRRINSREDVQSFKAEFEQKIKQIYSSDNLTELPELGRSISDTLKKFFPGSQLNLQWGDIIPPSIPLPPPKATLIEDGFEGDISRKGHGLQRALILTLLQHLAITTQSIDENTSNGYISEPDLILAIEEPELYLHPLRCRYLAKILFDLSNTPGLGLAARNQVLYTTHSPHFVDLERFNNIRIIKKEQKDKEIPESVVTYYALADAAQALAQVASTVYPITEKSFKAHSMPVMNTIVNEGFFADAIAIVEGNGEIGALWRLQEILGKNWIEKGISVIPAFGKNNIDRAVIIFTGFKIPCYFIFDGDANEKKESSKRTNRRYLKLAGATEEDFPETTVGNNYAVFKNNFEDTCKSELSQIEYNKIAKDISLKLGIEEKRILKNIDSASEFIHNVYQKGLRIPTLEKIVDEISNLI